MTVNDHLLALSQRDVPTDVTQLMRLCLFDWAACGKAGACQDVSIRLATSVHHCDEASTFGGLRLSAPDAALLNGTIGHALDYDDTHFDHIGHTSAVIMPAVLAASQRQIISDFDLILGAMAIGSEAAVRIGLWFGRDHYHIGFHQTATAGAFGATLAVASLLKLSECETINAIGLCATATSGLKGQFGTMGKPINAGLAARTAVESAIWAQGGITSDPIGMQTFSDTHHGQGETTAWDLSEPWKIMRVSHKFHACCHGLHAMLEALRNISIPVNAITRIEIATHKRWLSVCNRGNPNTGLSVKFSFRHTAAMALLGIDTARVENFSDEIAQDAKLTALRRKIQVIADSNLTEMQSRVTILTEDGEPIEVSYDLDGPFCVATQSGSAD